MDALCRGYAVCSPAYGAERIASTTPIIGNDYI